MFKARDTSVEVKVENDKIYKARGSHCFSFLTVKKRQ